MTIGEKIELALIPVLGIGFWVMAPALPDQVGVGRLLLAASEKRTRDGYRIWVRFSDGAAGEIDLSQLAGRGVFQAWEDRTFFETVHVSEAGAVEWGEDIDLCPDALYTQLTGKSVEDLMPGAQAMIADA